MEESIVQKLLQVRSRIEAIEEEKYRIALMYQYLIGGEAGEVSGENSPNGSDLIIKNIDVQGTKIKTAIFLVKTVRRVDHYRVCAIPYDPDIEPWTKIVADWFSQNQKTHPFRFSSRANLESNKKYLMDKASDAFTGLKWFKESYTIQGTRQERRWINFTSSQLRDLRLEVLRELYEFNEVELAYYGAWNITPINAQIKLRIENILDTNIDANNNNEIENIAKLYLAKLLVKFDKLGEDTSSRFFDPLNTKYRFEKAENITKLIQNINLISNIKLKTNIFNEDMGLVLDIFTPCDKDIKLKSNITNMMNLFEINLDRLKEIVRNPEDVKLIILFKKLLDENSVEYDEDMIETWRYMSLLRNYYNHPRDADKIEKVLTYFKQPIMIPINSNLLWNNILDQFEDSLYECLDVINNFEDSVFS